MYYLQLLDQGPLLQLWVPPLTSLLDLTSLVRHLHRNENMKNISFAKTLSVNKIVMFRSLPKVSQKNL